MSASEHVAQTASSAVSQTAGLRSELALGGKVIYQLRSTGARDFKNSKRTGFHSRGYLPHVKREGAFYFVTFRLADSLPKEVLLRFKEEWAAELRVNPKAAGEAAKNLQRKIERCLDKSVGSCFLKDRKIATIARDALLYFVEKRYDLEDWVIMPNHVHLVVRPVAGHTLSTVLHGRKTFIAREANLVLGRVGKPFWQPESYDHWVRDAEEKARICRYVRNNPVKAGLCRRAEDWEWGSGFSKAHVAV